MEVPDTELADMIVEFDTDKDGQINEHEFMVSVGAWRICSSKGLLKRAEIAEYP